MVINLMAINLTAVKLTAILGKMLYKSKKMEGFFLSRTSNYVWNLKIFSAKYVWNLKV